MRTYGGCGRRRHYPRETIYLALLPRLVNNSSIAHGSGYAMQQRQETVAASAELPSRLVNQQKV